MHFRALAERSGQSWLRLSESPSHGQSCRTEPGNESMARADDRTKPPEKREIWSFFTGAMGLDLGLEQSGLGATLTNEIDPLFCKTIQLNRPGIDLIEGDITNLSADELRRRRNWYEEVHLMVGGPPCQPFSSGGKRAALSDPRGNLIYEYIRLVTEVQPRYFVLENVANLATAALRHRPIADRPGKRWNLRHYEKRNLGDGDGALPMEQDEMAGSALRQILSDMEALGYYITFAVVDAADYGAPQHRLRFVMIGAKDFPPPSLSAPSFGVGRKPYVTVREAIGHLIDAPGPHSEYTEPVRAYFELVPPGGNWRSLPKCLQEGALGGAYNSGGGKTGFFRRLSWDAPSPTITGRANRKGSALCHPAESRPLSVLECAALQGFPADWKLHGAMNTRYMQVGNAVPVHLGRAIGEAITAHEASVTARKQARKAAWEPNVDQMLTAAMQRVRSAGRNKRSLLVA
jgi:DNA (cytosine-5)-methyltransferase 1